ncbi:hypothetical protein HYS99_01075 [Candidatus Giovannonibacteria bacterium]|nr:hypothetical protein [Candidatus Giovannonibacteria bacterium]
MNNVLPIHPEEVTTKLFGILPKRTKDMLEMRFGLGKNVNRMTLEAIGKKYGITRERVRQVEADGITRIRKSVAMKEMAAVFESLENYFVENGRVMHESTVLKNLAPHPKHENHVYFLLTLSDPILRFHETDELKDRWAMGKEAEQNARKTLEHASEELRKVGRPISEGQLYDILSASTKNVVGNEEGKHVLVNWISLSKLISKNYFDEWGLNEFSSIKPRGVRDLSYMVLGKRGSPLHFSGVATEIGKLIGKSVHVQTVHNELIKDPRFVLVGRGLYALNEWGYQPGIVRDVISDLLREHGPLSKEKIISHVLERRFVKPNTVLINLENKKYFKKLPNGSYTTLR